jgi:putative RecB family exonuclease
MALELPTTLSPSKVSSFKDCALAFRFSAIDRLPEAPSAPATKGTLVHDALRRLLWRPSDERTLPNAMLDLAVAQRELEDHPDYADLGLEPDDAAQFYADAEQLVRNYFELEDPATVNPMGLELDLSVTVGSLKLRGIIDRLERGPDGGLVVTDYKSGSTPRIQYEQGRLGGVHFYAYLCEQLLGERPARVQLLYLSEPIAIIATPSDQSIRGFQQKATAVWTAIERACEREDFRPRPSKLCDWCSFQAYCPAFGGNPQDARQPAAVAS